MPNTSRGSSRLSTESDVEVSGRNKGIREIDLAGVFSSAEDAEMLSLITAFDLSRNEITALEGLQPLTALRRLDVSYNAIGRVGGLPLALTVLDISHNRLSSLGGIAALTQLRELDVSFNRLQSLAGLGATHVPALQVLRADDNRLTTTAGLEEMPRLRVVSLRNNFVENVNDLLFLESARALRMLDLRGNPITRLRSYRRLAAQHSRSLLTLDEAPLLREAPEEVQPPRAAQASPAAARPAAASVVTPPKQRTSSVRATSACNRSSGSSTGSSNNNSGSVAGRTRSARPAKTATPAARAASSQAQRPGSRQGRHPQPEPVPASSAPAAPSAVSFETSLLAPPQPEPQAPVPTPKQQQQQPQRQPSAGRRGARRRLHPERDLTSTSDLNRTPNGSDSGGYAAQHEASLARAGALVAAPASPGGGGGGAEERRLVARLHDSLVEKEQLERENAFLRAKGKKLEEALSDARRVISEQLAELSAARLERDGLRRNEEALAERAERDRRNARAAGQHHRDELAAVREQHERMKAFYEAQMADLRRQLAAEMARTRRLAPPPQQQQQHPAAAAATAASSTTVRVSSSRDGDDAEDDGEGSAVRAEGTQVQHTAAKPPPPLAALRRRLSDERSPASPAEGAAADAGELAAQLKRWLYAEMAGDVSREEEQRLLRQLRESLEADAGAAPGTNPPPRALLEAFLQHTQSQMREQQQQPPPPPPPEPSPPATDVFQTPRATTASAAEVSSPPPVPVDDEHARRVSAARELLHSVAHLFSAPAGKDGAAAGGSDSVF